KKGGKVAPLIRLGHYQCALGSQGGEGMAEEYRTRQQARLTNPVRVDPHFVDGLKRLLEHYDAAVVKLVAAKYDVTIRRLTAVKEPPNRSENLIRARYELNVARKIEFVLTYDNDYTFNLTDLDQLVNV